MLGTLLISPHLLAYDLTLLLLPCALLVSLGHRLAAVLAGSLYLTAIVSPVLAPTLSFQPVVVVMFIALVVLRRMSQPAIV